MYDLVHVRSSLVRGFSRRACKYGWVSSLAETVEFECNVGRQSMGLSEELLIVDALTVSNSLFLRVSNLCVPFVGLHNGNSARPCVPFLHQTPDDSSTHSAQAI